MIEKADEIIIYNTEDGKTNVKLYAQDGMIWMNQQQIALLFESSKQNISLYIANILNDKELDGKSVVKNYLTTASDGKNYEITYYALPMILAIGFRVRTMLYWKENFDKILVDNGFSLLNDKGGVLINKRKRKLRLYILNLMQSARLFMLLKQINRIILNWRHWKIWKKIKSKEITLLRSTL